MDIKIQGVQAEPRRFCLPVHPVQWASIEEIEGTDATPEIWVVLSATRMRIIQLGSIHIRVISRKPDLTNLFEFKSLLLLRWGVALC
jgi:hypothetical protein